MCDIVALSLLKDVRMKYKETWIPEDQGHEKLGIIFALAFIDLVLKHGVVRNTLEKHFRCGYSTSVSGFSYWVNCMLGICKNASKFLGEK